MIVFVALRKTFYFIDKHVKNFHVFFQKNADSRVVHNPSMYIFCAHLFVECDLLTPVTVRNNPFASHRRPCCPHRELLNFGTRKKYFSAVTVCAIGRYSAAILYQSIAQ